MANSRPASLYVTSCESGPDAWTHQADLLRAAIPQAQPDATLADSPESADFIFITDLREEHDFLALRRHPLLRKFPHKVFAYSDADGPPRFVRGVMTSLTRSPFNWGRFQSGSYFLYHPDFRNPFIDQWHRDGVPACPKKYLFSFMGRKCNALRAQLLALRFDRDDILLEDTSSFVAFTHEQQDKNAQRERYARVLLESKFVLCPRGNGAASIRLFEAMQLGVAPVIISDEWILPAGPDWSRCSIRIRSQDLGRIEAILAEREPHAAELGRAARETYDNFFHGAAYVRYLAQAASKIHRASRLTERIIQRALPAALLLKKAARRLRRKIREHTPRPTPPPLPA